MSETAGYGDGSHRTRLAARVSDHEAIDLIINKGRVGEYNIGGHNERTNLEAVKTILKALDKPESFNWLRQADRSGHDLRYAPLIRLK